MALTIFRLNAAHRLDVFCFAPKIASYSVLNVVEIDVLFLIVDFLSNSLSQQYIPLSN